ncbi:hypothetical protein V6U81_11840 [Micromonospora sp. CPCC 205711]|uniref:hypothetical protein n=1 Tax=Micromonospora sp. CPCC 205547 TaxID=3122400 RepID=UPI002FF0184C
MTDDGIVRIGPGPSRRAARRVARSRQRRRWALGGAAALGCLVGLAAYVGSGPQAPPPDADVLPAGLPTPVSTPTAVGQPTEAGFASPGLRPRERTPSPTATPSPVSPSATPSPTPATATLEVGVADVPAVVDLTGLGGRDWVHWGLRGTDQVVRKRGGTGEIRDEGGRGERGSYDTNPEFFRWHDGTPDETVEGTATGVHVCGVGNGFALSVAGSGQDRTVDLFTGVWMARGRLDVRLSTGGPTRSLRLEDPHTTHTARFVIRFRAQPGAKLLVNWTVEEIFGGCGNVDLSAAALR